VTKDGTGIARHFVRARLWRHSALQDRRARRQGHARIDIILGVVHSRVFGQMLIHEWKIFGHLVQRGKLLN
jgi:hypothetical protein